MMMIDDADYDFFVGAVADGSPPPSSSPRSSPPPAVDFFGAASGHEEDWELLRRRHGESLLMLHGRGRGGGSPDSGVFSSASSITTNGRIMSSSSNGSSSPSSESSAVSGAGGGERSVGRARIVRLLPARQQQPHQPLPRTTRSQRLQQTSSPTPNVLSSYHQLVHPALKKTNDGGGSDHFVIVDDDAKKMWNKNYVYGFGAPSEAPVPVQSRRVPPGSRSNLYVFNSSQLLSNSITSSKQVETDLGRGGSVITAQKRKIVAEEEGNNTAPVEISRKRGRPPKKNLPPPAVVEPPPQRKRGFTAAEPGDNVLMPTDEERAIAEQEGVLLPPPVAIASGGSPRLQRPLSKAQEAALLDIRRRLRNRRLAEANRRRKQDQTSILAEENAALRQHIEQLSAENAELAAKLRKLQIRIGAAQRGRASAGACLAVCLLSVCMLAVQPKTTGTSLVYQQHQKIQSNQQRQIEWPPSVQKKSLDEMARPSSKTPAELLRTGSREGRGAKRLTMIGVEEDKEGESYADEDETFSPVFFNDDYNYAGAVVDKSHIRNLVMDEIQPSSWSSNGYGGSMPVAQWPATELDSSVASLNNSPLSLFTAVGEEDSYGYDNNFLHLGGDKSYAGERFDGTSLFTGLFGLGEGELDALLSSASNSPSSTSSFAYQQPPTSVVSYGQQQKQAEKEEEDAIAALDRYLHGLDGLDSDFSSFG